MILSDIILMFRTENPDISDRVITDALLKNWCLIGDKEFCAVTRCIISDFTFSSITSTTVYATKYDLITYESKFYDIDTYPGGGVSFDNDILKETSVSELDKLTPTWRTRSASYPRKFYRRGQHLYFDYPISSTYSSKTVRVYSILVSDDFSNDSQEPYNQLGYLKPFHYGMVKYLKWKAKEKVGKPNEGAQAGKEFRDYALWAKKEIGGGKYSPIRFIKKI